MDQEDKSDQISAARSQLQFHQPDLKEPGTQQPRSSIMSAGARWTSGSTADTDIVAREDGLSNGTATDVGSTVSSRCPADSDAAAPGSHTDGMSEFSNNDLSLPEVCISSNSNSFEENMNYEVQQAYRIFSGFLLDKHKGIASPFLQPIGHQEAQHGIGGVCGQGPAQLKQSMCLRRIEEKFVQQEYQTITEFVADFRWMLENCYRYHGVDHWISKQAQKMEIMLEQKLTLLSRTLREKTTLSVTSKGRFGAEEDRGSGGTSTRRRLAPRSLATITVGGHESIMVQTLRLEEQQRAKEEKRQRELEKKEAEEMSAKEVEEWEQGLLSQASPHTVDTLWELPAVGHFLCLAQTALNLPEIVFYELERCLLMPRCSILLSKIMTSLLSPWQRRATLHRRPPLPYRRWESELRQRVLGWYRTVGSARDQPTRAEQLGLCHQFFSVLGEVSPLEEKPFHLLVFYQRVWLLKGLCDHVYETNKDVQDAVLAQPIHECRESILGYDSKENAYIHFPHFCGADLRIYCQSPSTPPGFPFPSVWVKRVEVEQGMEGEESDALKDEGDKAEDRRCEGASMDTGESDDFGRDEAEVLGLFKRENGEEEEDDERFKSWSLKKEEGSESGSSDGNPSKVDLKIHTNSSPLSHTSPTGVGDMKRNVKEETVELGHQSKRLSIKQEPGFSLSSERTIKAETQDPCLSVGEHCYTGRSPARSANTASPNKLLGIKMEEGSPSQGNQRSSCLECCRNKTSNVNSEQPGCCCGTSGLATQSSDSTQNSSEERVADRIWTKKKKWKKKRGREQLPGMKGRNRQLQHVHRMSLYPAEAGKSAVRRVTTTIKRKDKKKNKKAGKKIESAKKVKDEPPAEPSFKLVCSSLEELRELISKTEDELDDLESTKKRLGRWYYRREAVKELHSTLIRLLNELSPWEPKLVKAYQRNRLRLKKEFDEFKKHPEYNNFVREECISSSSSSSEDDEEGSLGKELGSLEHYRRTEEDLEHAVPRGLWSGASTREIVAESVGDKTTYVSPNHLKPILASPERGFGVLPRPQTDIASPGDSGLQSSFELIPLNQSKESDSATHIPVQASLSPRATILHPTTGLPKGYTPIPTLLAKSVGNKVTLMKRPVDSLGFKSIESQSKTSLVSSPTSAMATTKLSKAQSSLSISTHNSDQLQGQGLQPTKVLLQQGLGTVMAAPLKPPQAKPIQTVPKNPVQVVYKVPEGLGHLVCNDSNPVKVSLHPVLDQNTGEKIMQQVVILPSNLLIHKTEEKGSSYNQPPTKGIQVPVSKVESPICMSTNVPGFNIPESRIPVQQVAPLKDTRTPRTPSPSVSPCLQHGTLKTSFKEAQISSTQTSTPQVIKPNSSAISTPMSATPLSPAKSPDHKQELQTVCIRDSQSILVTTRGGNTGIVKVQTSSDQNAFGCLPSSPVITISPQFKAFLLSKTQIPASAPSQTSSCSVPAVASISVAQPQKQLSPLLKSPSTVATPVVSGLAGSVPVPGPGSQTTGTAVASSQGSNNATGSTVVTRVSQLPQPSLIKSTVVPSLSSTGVPQVLTQSERINKPRVKRASTDERSQVTKFILVSPTSSAVSNVSPSKETPSSKSGVMFINQPTGTSQTTFMGSAQKQAITTGASTQLPTPSLSSQTLKMGLNLGQPVGGLNVESLSKVKNFTLPAGLHIQLSGKTTTIGQTIGSLSHSSSKSTPVSISDTGCSLETSTQLVPFTSSNTTTNCPAKLPTNSYQLQGVPSFTPNPQLGSSTSASAPLPAAIMTKKDCSLPVGVLPSKSAQVTPTLQSLPPKDTDTHATQTQNMQTNVSEEPTSILASPQLSLSKTQTATINHAPFTASSTVQQRIIINSSTPLAAGTQIFLNNARFVVPPQGLGPGSHVLIISNPAPQKVPSTIATGIGAAVPPQGASHVTVAPRAPILPQSPVRLPGVPAVSSPFVACTPTVAPSLLATAPSVKPVQLTGAPLNKTSVVTALPRLPTSQICNFATPPVNTSTLVSSSPQLGGQISTLVPSAPGLGSTLATFRLATGVASRAECLSSMSPSLAPALSKLSASLTPSPVLSSPSAITLPITVIPSAPHSSPEQQEVSLTPVDAAGRIGAASTTAPQSPAILNSTLIKKQVPGVIQPVLAGTRPQMVPTVSLPPIVSTVSRMQTLPIATVPPIGSTINVFETSPVVTTPPSSSTVFITPAQPVTSLKTNDAIPQPIVVTNPALGKHSMQTSSLGLHNSVASKLLISPDGAVLSTVQVNPAELTGCPKPLAALMVSPNSSTGALHTHDSYLQPPQTDTSRTN